MIIGTNEPIGRFIAAANLKRDIFPQKAIEQKAENLIDLITIRLKTRSIEEVSQSLLKETFELRIDILEWFYENNGNFKNYSEVLSNSIAVNLQLAPYSKLSKTISSVLLKYEEITSPIFQQTNHSFEEIIRNIKAHKPQYETLKFISLHPSPPVQYLKKWVDASLNLETGLILSDLILTGQIDFSIERIENELINFLHSTMNKFGAYSIFTGFWKPNANDVSNSTNSMKILAATIELDNKVYTKVSKDSLFELINNNSDIRYVSNLFE